MSWRSSRISGRRSVPVTFCAFRDGARAAAGAIATPGQRSLPMKRPWAVILTATASVGCRSTQPATNPFLQTTVPPPATGAPVVVPGEQFSPGVVPAPAVAPVPQVITPAVPVAPPPVVAPPKGKFDPPGGSFQYNQSSLERSQSGMANPVMLGELSTAGPGPARESNDRLRDACPSPQLQAGQRRRRRVTRQAKRCTIRILPPQPARPRRWILSRRWNPR